MPTSPEHPGAEQMKPFPRLVSRRYIRLWLGWKMIDRADTLHQII